MKRITAEEFTAFYKQGNKKFGKYSKYKNNKTEVDGYVFASNLEAEYYSQLKLRLKAKDILSFRVQPKYILQEAFKKYEKTFRKIEYIADFEIKHNDGSIEVIDVKGYKTDVFRIKRKNIS